MSDDGKIGEFTPEKIEFDKLSEVVKICLCEAMAAHQDSSGQRLPKEFFQPPGGHEVLLVINGRQFPVEPIFKLFDAQYDQHVAQAARRLAEEKVNLSPVVDRLYRLSHEFNEELDRLFPGTKSDSAF